ncbi:MAG: CBS domain-containing protein [Bacillaceae bacterium]|nr:CBS domain-containing protein [Bacillaceae bacterium]
MNIAFFLLPKTEVAFVHSKATIRQALEKMEYHQYTAVPIIDSNGKYVGTLTEGDLLWKIKELNLCFDSINKVYINDIKRRLDNMPVHINANMEDLLSLAAVQNFVPVVDDHDIFIGIIRRKEIIEYYANKHSFTLSSEVV